MGISLNICIVFVILTLDFLFSLQYLLAMVFAYFKRAGLKIREYTLMNFFIAL